MNAAGDAAVAPFEDSRRLMGANLYFDAPGVVLETAPGLTFDTGTLQRWRANIDRARAALGWPDGAVCIRKHATGASLAFEAPIDQLFVATEANEWALWKALLPPLQGEGRGGDGVDAGSTPLPHPHPNPPLEGEGFRAPGHAAVWDEESALHTLQRTANAEANPTLIALLDAARAHQVPVRWDDDWLSLGEGDGARQWPLTALPAVDEVPWPQLHAIPKALVTGSNGKTTTVRLLAALLAESGRKPGYSSTDGVVIDGTRIEGGDYSGPAGARTVLRAPQVQAAVLETARGGMLRRGLAVDDAQAAIVTNVSEDHFGEYGIDNLADLAEVKLVVAKALAADGLLVLNANDPCLVAQASRLQGVRIGWFAQTLDHAIARGLPACGGRDGHLILCEGANEHDLGAIAAMPLTIAGAARYNIENIAAAALAAQALGVAPEDSARVLARFGQHNADNPGRLQRWQLGGVEVVLDYAHNPEGLHGLLELAATLRKRRLGILLGHAGNRLDADYLAVASTVASAKPERVWLKDIGGNYLRGRASGEVAAILRDALHAHGLPLDALPVCLDEARAAREALAWAQPGDLLLLPIHEPGKREQVVALLDQLQASGWQAGRPLPDT